MHAHAQMKYGLNLGQLTMIWDAPMFGVALFMFLSQLYRMSRKLPSGNHVSSYEKLELWHVNP